MASFLISKNRKYGDSALNPIQIFCKADAEIQILARIDDKINRLLQDNSHEDEDIVWDLMGYLVLLTVKRRMNEPSTDYSAEAHRHLSSTVDESQLVYSIEAGKGRWSKRTDTRAHREDSVGPEGT